MRNLRHYIDLIEAAYPGRPTGSLDTRLASAIEREDRYAADSEGMGRKKTAAQHQENARLLRSAADRLNAGQGIEYEVQRLERAGLL